MSPHRGARLYALDPLHMSHSGAAAQDAVHAHAQLQANGASGRCAAASSRTVAATVRRGCGRELQAGGARTSMNSAPSSMACVQSSRVSSGSSPAHAGQRVGSVSGFKARGGQCRCACILGNNRRAKHAMAPGCQSGSCRGSAGGREGRLVMHFSQVRVEVRIR